MQLGLHGPSAVLRAARAMRRRLRAAGTDPDGFVVQAMAPPGVELLVGCTADPQFGPVIACAAGGTTAELLADVAVRLGPLTEADVADCRGPCGPSRCSPAIAARRRPTSRRSRTSCAA